MNQLIFRWKTRHEVVYNKETILASRADVSFWNLYGVTGLREYLGEMAMPTSQISKQEKSENANG